MYLQGNKFIVPEHLGYPFKDQKPAKTALFSIRLGEISSWCAG